MKKLVLKPEDLRVDTFTTAGQMGRGGTVAAHYGTGHTGPVETCGFSCEGTCGGSTCDYTCANYMTSPGPDYPCILCGG